MNNNSNNHHNSTTSTANSKYEIINKIDEGSYGVVYRVKHIEKGTIYAMKKVKILSFNEGFPIHALREITVIKNLQHPNIVNLVEVVNGKRAKDIFLVLEFCEHNLRNYLEVMANNLFESEIKCLFKQLLQGLSFLHQNWIIHRDIKTDNLLMRGGTLKICDFGLARKYEEPLSQYTNNVASLWYRAPELFLGETVYSCSVDVWSMGCVFSEIVVRKSLFSGRNEAEMMTQILDVSGINLTEEEEIQLSQRYKQMYHVIYKDVFVKHRRKRLQHQPTTHVNIVKSKLLSLLRSNGNGNGNMNISVNDGFDLISTMLNFAPDSRISALQALNHNYFSLHPPPRDPDFLPVYRPTH